MVNQTASYKYTITKYRDMGLGKAVVLEALNRCRNLGAKEAFVISEQEFYRKLGFKSYSHYTFYWKQEKGYENEN